MLRPGGQRPGHCEFTPLPFPSCSWLQPCNLTGMLFLSVKGQDTLHMPPLSPGESRLAGLHHWAGLHEADQSECPTGAQRLLSTSEHLLSMHIDTHTVYGTHARLVLTCTYMFTCTRVHPLSHRHLIVIHTSKHTCGTCLRVHAHSHHMFIPTQGHTTHARTQTYT